MGARLRVLCAGRGLSLKCAASQTFTARLHEDTRTAFEQIRERLYSIAEPNPLEKLDAFDGRGRIAMSASQKDTLTITDNRTGKQYEVPITDGTIRAMDLRQIKTEDAEDFGLMTYDPAFMNTASCKSTITYIDGDKGILEYRGYPIEQLAEQSTYLEVAYLLLHGELPTP